MLGDPNQWSKVLAGLEAVRQATRPRGARTVVVIVHPPDVPAAEVPEDKLAGIIRQSGTERKCVNISLKMCSLIAAFLVLNAVLAFLYWADVEYLSVYPAYYQVLTLRLSMM